MHYRRALSILSKQVVFEMNSQFYFSNSTRNVMFLTISSVNAHTFPSPCIAGLRGSTLKSSCTGSTAYWKVCLHADRQRIRKLVCRIVSTLIATSLGGVSESWSAGWRARRAACRKARLQARPELVGRRVTKLFSTLVASSSGSVSESSSG